MQEATSKRRMKLIVTGGAGFVGSALVNFLVANDHEVILVDDFSTGKLSNLRNSVNKITIIEEKVENIDFQSFSKIDGIVHLAAQASVPVSISDFKKSSATNLLSTINIIDYCGSQLVPLVYASSSAVYGSLELGDDEASTVDLLSPYSVDKFSMELYAAAAMKLHNLSSIGLRFFNVYGPRQDPNNPYSGVISIFIDRLIKGLPITINGGHQTRDFIYVDDVVNCLYQAMLIARAQPISETVNVLTGVSTSIDSLADILSEQIGFPAKKLYRPLAKGDVVQSSGTQKKMKKMLGLKTSSFTNLETGLKETIDFLRMEYNDF